MILSPHIFRAYDIRGKAFRDFDEDGFFVVAAAFGNYIKEKSSLTTPKILVSGDGRTSMPELYPAVLAGLKSVGCDVIWGGAIPTPINFFAFHEGNFDGGMQITASHNPPDENGIKMIARKGSLSGEEIQEIGKRAGCIKCLDSKNYGKCAKNCESVDFSGKYFEKIRAVTANQKNRNIVVDAGNGIAGMFYPEIFRKLGHTVTELFCDLDTTFPNHQPDPERPENLKSLVEKVRETNADFGFSFDGDGDRIGIVLNSGEIISADKILFCLASDFLSRNTGAPVVIDAMSSQILAEKINHIGGKAVISKTGHSFIEEKMRETKALLGGEQSGHFMFKENFYGHDDACLAGLRFIAAVGKEPNLLQQITTGWPKLVEWNEKFAVPEERKFEIMEKIKEKLLSEFPDASTQDGIRIHFGGNEWAIVRASNTTPKIAIRLEAESQKSFDQKKDFLQKITHASQQ